MPLLEVFCFKVPVRTGSIVVCTISFMWSVAGLICAGYTIVEYPRLPGGKNHKSLIMFYLLQAGYFYSFIGVMFHAVLVILTILLAFAIGKRRPRCIIPWMIWFLIMLCGVVFQTFWSWNVERDVGIFVACASLPFCAIMTYFLLVVLSYYQQLADDQKTSRPAGPASSATSSIVEAGIQASASCDKIISPSVTSESEEMEVTVVQEPKDEIPVQPGTSDSSAGSSSSIQKSKFPRQSLRTAARSRISSPSELKRLQKMKAKTKRKFYTVYNHEALLLYH